MLNLNGRSDCLNELHILSAPLTNNIIENAQIYGESKIPLLIDMKVISIPLHVTWQQGLVRIVMGY